MTKRDWKALDRLLGRYATAAGKAADLAEELFYKYDEILGNEVDKGAKHVKSS